MNKVYITEDAIIKKSRLHFGHLRQDTVYKLSVKTIHLWNGIFYHSGYRRYYETRFQMGLGKYGSWHKSQDNDNKTGKCNNSTRNGAASVKTSAKASTAMDPLTEANIIVNISLVWLNYPRAITWERCTCAFNSNKFITSESWAVAASRTPASFTPSLRMLTLRRYETRPQPDYLFLQEWKSKGTQKRGVCWRDFGRLSDDTMRWQSIITSANQCHDDRKRRG